MGVEQGVDVWGDWFTTMGLFVVVLVLLLVLIRILMRRFGAPPDMIELVIVTLEKRQIWMQEQGISPKAYVFEVCREAVKMYEEHRGNCAYTPESLVVAVREHPRFHRLIGVEG